MDYYTLAGSTPSAALHRKGRCRFATDSAGGDNTDQRAEHPVRLAHFEQGSNKCSRPRFQYGKARHHPAHRPSLARLLKRQGKTKEARSMLAEIYNWFTEGFDTADLKDAKTLLNELAE